MHKRLVAVALEAVAIPALGLAAYGIAHSVSDSPRPEVILPSGSSATTAAPHRAGNDGGNPTSATQPVPGHEQGIHNPAAATEVGHDAGDDHGVETTAAQPAPDNDAGDDHGADGPPAAAASAGAGNPDEHGGTAVTTTQVSDPGTPVTAAPAPSIADNRGGRAGGGASHDAAGQ